MIVASAAALLAGGAAFVTQLVRDDATPSKSPDVVMTGREHVEVRGQMSVVDEPVPPAALVAPATKPADEPIKIKMGKFAK